MRLSLAIVILLLLAVLAHAESRFYVRETWLGCTSVRTNAYALTYGDCASGRVYVYEADPYWHPRSRRRPHG